jgi:hypothetical protein
LQALPLLALGANTIAEVPSGQSVRRRESILIAGQMVLLAAAVIAAVVATDSTDWEPWSLFVALLALAILGEFLAVPTGGVHIGAAFIATSAAMALLGPAPAALIAVAAVLAWSLRNHRPRSLLFNNIVACATYPVVGALIFQALGDQAKDDSAELGTAAIVFGVYLAVNFLNFLLIVGYLCLRDGTSLVAEIRRVYIPVLPWEVATGTFTAGTVLAYQEIGLPAVAMLAFMLLSYYSLLRSVVEAQSQRDELRAQVEELEALHHGVIRVMVETLGMRDRMTARHSAAVARFAKAIAAAWCTRPGCCTTSGSSRSRTTRSPGRRSPRRTGRSYGHIPDVARTSSSACTATRRSPRSCSATTSGWTVAATRAGSAARTSRCWPGSSPSRTAST